MKKNPWDVENNNNEQKIEETSVNNDKKSHKSKNIDELFKEVLKNVKKPSNNGKKNQFFNKNDVKWNKKYTIFIILLMCFICKISIFWDKSLAKYKNNAIIIAVHR